MVKPYEMLPSSCVPSAEPKRAGSLKSYEMLPGSDHIVGAQVCGAHGQAARADVNWIGKRPHQFTYRVSATTSTLKSAEPWVSRHITAYEILSVSTLAAVDCGGGCGGNCGPCGGLKSARALTSGMRLPTDLQPEAVGRSQFNPPVLRGGPSRSTCESIHREIEQLINYYYRLDNRCMPIWRAVYRCREGSPVDCYSFEVDNRILEDELRDLANAWNDAGEGPAAEEARREIDRRRTAIADYREFTLSPAWDDCSEQVNMNANVRRAECFRLRRQLQDCNIARRRLGEYILKAFDNYVIYAQRIGCAIDPGLRIAMGGVADSIRYSSDVYNDFDIHSDGSLLFHPFDDYIFFEVPF